MKNSEIYLHVGAHRTGTSSFQMCLAINRSVLGQEGYDVAYPGRDDIPQGTLRLPLPAPRHDDGVIPVYSERIHRRLAGHGDRLVLSEENILGKMVHFTRGAFYPGLEQRLETLRRGSEPRSIKHVTLVVRDYAGLFLSAYRKRAEDQIVAPFHEVRENLATVNRGWPEVVVLLRDVLRPESLSVVDYGARGTSIQLLKRLVADLDKAPLEEPAKLVNFSATDAALVDLQKRYANSQKLERQEWQSVIAEYSRDTKPLGFAEFTPKQAVALEARYEMDLERLENMPGIELIA